MAGRQIENHSFWLSHWRHTNQKGWGDPTALWSYAYEKKSHAVKSAFRNDTPLLTLQYLWVFFLGYVQRSKIFETDVERGASYICLVL